MSSGETSEKDLYRESFKHFKNFTFASGKSVNRGNSCSNNITVSEEAINGVLLPDPPEAGDNHHEEKEEEVIRRDLHYEPNSSCECYKRWGLRHPETWEVVELTFPAGLVVIKNPFTPNGQRYWISRTLLDFPHHQDYVTNMDNLNRLVRLKSGLSTTKLSDFKLDTCSRDFYVKLRWVTFGYHHDWDTKVYSEDMKSTFPEDLADMTKYVSQILGFSDFEAEAAIANYYHLDSTLSGHVDRSEVNQSAPLFSLSFGQSAIFLIGGGTKFQRPKAVLLRSGDIAVMSGESRMSYHGVPRILPTTSMAWVNDECSGSNKSNLHLHKRRKLDHNTTSCHENPSYAPVHNCESFASTLKDRNVSVCNGKFEWTAFLETYIRKSRINLNIRQVLFPGQTCLFPESSVDKKY